MSKGTERLAVKVLSPQGARLEVLPASGPPPEAQAKDLVRLLFRAPVQPGVPVRLAVALMPHDADAPAPDGDEAVEPLDAWGR